MSFDQKLSPDHPLDIGGNAWSHRGLVDFALRPHGAETGIFAVARLGPGPMSHAPHLPPRPPMFAPDAVMIEKPTMDAITTAEWRIIEAQRARHMHGVQARLVLDLLNSAAADPSFGYAVSMYTHGLQAATLALEAGQDEEFVVVCLLHDIGFTVAGPSHGEFSAALLRPYISERNRWTLEMHQLFGFPHMQAHPDMTTDQRERFRGHPHFEATAEFVARYDQTTVDPGLKIYPVAAFEPMVHRLFARPPARRFA